MQTSSHSHKKPLVRRITVDERLDETLIRMLTASLSDSVKKIITDDFDNWGPEQRENIDSENYLSFLLGTEKDDKFILHAIKEITGETAKTTTTEIPPDQLLWRLLEEGQVFIVGQFEVLGSKHNPEAIRIHEGANGFLRIDQIGPLKENNKKLYSQTLIGKEKRNDSQN